MDFNKSERIQSLRGASKPEVSKEALVKDLHKQREERVAKRQREAAAEKIQSAWRGRQTRLEQTERLLKEWLTQFGPFVADAQKHISPIELYRDVLPPVLFSVLPPYSEAFRRLVHEGHGLTVRQLGQVVAVRGALALVLSTLTNLDDTYSYLTCSVQPELKNAWLSQCYKLLLLCCGVLGIQELWSDGLLQGAAVRTLSHLTDPSSWKIIAASQSSCGALLKRLSQAPTLYEALERVLERTESMLFDRSSASASSGAPVGINETEALLRVAVHSLDALFGDPAFELRQLRSFIKSALTVERLWERLAAIVPSHVFQNLQRTLAVHVGILLDALQGMADLPPDDKCCALANVTQLAAGCLSQRPAGNNQSRVVFTSGEAIGSSISSQDYLQKSLSVLNQCPLATPEGQIRKSNQLLVFAEPAHVIHLIRLVDQDKADEIELFADVYLTLMHKVYGGDMRRAMPYCNVIAFADDVFPLLWNWLSTELKVPCKAAYDAKQWTYPSLSGGLTGLTAPQRAVLALFCQAYAHLLLVLDDEDFHSKQHPLTLDHNRAIASALCNLAFHTYYDRKTVEKTPTEGESWLSIVDQHFPILLRRLYERDNRQLFCPGAMWLAPFYTHIPVDARYTLVAPAILQALLNRTAGGMEGVVSSATAHVLGICNLLLTAPQCVPFESRVDIFRDLIKADKERLLLSLPFGENGLRPIKVTVHRNRMFRDAMQQLGQLGSQLKGQLYVTIIDAFNIEEPGVDHGGLTVELIEEVIQAGIHPDAGLFERNPEGYLYCSHIAEQHPQGASMLYFLGEMLGKALYEGLLIDVPLAPFFLLRLQERTLMFDDLATLDADLHRNLIQLKRYDGDASDFGLDFTVEAEIAGRRMSEELIPGGSEVPVTDQNKLQYVHLMADWHINKKVGRVVHAFGAGFAQIIPIPWLRLFNPQELNALLTGGEGLDISLEDLRRHTLYKSGYSDYSLVVRGFWRVVAGFSPPERAALLKFVTSCSRPPLGGFQHLQPPFTICKVCLMLF